MIRSKHSSSVSRHPQGKPVIEKFVVADAENNIHQRPNRFEASDTVYEKPSLFDYNNGSIDLQVYSSLEYIGQYHGTYLLFQNEDGLFLMDQHAAAERIRYERYRKKMGEPVVGVYRLLVPIPLRGSVADKTLIDDQACDKLASLGVSLQAKELHYEIVEVPNWFPRGHEAEFVETILISISENRQASAAELLDDLAILLSCKHSLKANKYVDPRSAGVLLRDLSQCENPYTCPHGRPIFVNLSHARSRNCLSGPDHETHYCYLRPDCQQKSHVAIAIAKRFPSEIISADAFQIYRGMDIGTAKCVPRRPKAFRIT